MKKNINIVLASLICLIAVGFTACKSDMDNNPQFNKPTKFVLNETPHSSGLFDLENTKTVRLTCSQPDYGYAAATVYNVQVCLDESFADDKVQDIAEDFSSCVIDLNANDLAVALCSAVGVIDETSVPADPIEVFVRVKAQLPNVGEESVIYSNAIKLPKVQLYYALPDVVMPANMYMIGNFCGWDWSKSAKMVKVNGKDNQWWCIRYVGGEGQGAKFNYAKSWDGNEIGFDKVTIENADACGTVSSDDGNIIVEKPGWYIFCIQADVVGRDYAYTLNIFEPKIYIYGPTNGGNWGNDDAWAFSIPTEPDGKFVSPALVAEGEVRMCINPGWGEAWWAKEFTLYGGTIYYREDDNIVDSWGKDKGADYSVQGAAGKVITLDFNTETGKIE